MVTRLLLTFTPQANATDATWRIHPYTRKGHLFLGAQPHRALCGTLTFHAGYRPATTGTYCARCVRAAQRLSSASIARLGI
jgi:hypothetical protein